MTDPLGQSQVIPYLSGLVKYGYKIFLLSVEKPDRFEAHRIFIEKLMIDEGIIWHPIFYKSRFPFVSGALNIRNMYQKAKEIVLKHDIKLVHGRAAVATMSAQKLKRKFGVPFVFDMRGFWVDEKVDGNLWNLEKPVHKKAHDFLKKKEKQFLLEAAHVVSLTEKGKEIILKMPDLDQINITVIPCCADLDFFNYQTREKNEREKLRSALHISNQTLVVNYLGSWGTWYMPDEMMLFFSELLKLNNDALFLIISQDKPEIIYQSALKFDIPKDKILIKSATRKEVPAYLSASDFSLFFIKPLFSKQASSPTKMGELMGMGLPLVCNAGVGDVEEIMKDGSGVVVHEFSVQAMNSAAKQIMNVLHVDKEINRRCALKHYSLKDGVEKFKKIYDNILIDDGKDALE